MGMVTVPARRPASGTHSPEPVAPERRTATTATTTAPRTNRIETEPQEHEGLWARLTGDTLARRVAFGAMGLLSVGGAFTSPAMAATRAAEPTDPAATAKYKNIVYIGMNHGSTHEVSSLRNIVGYNGVKYVKPGKTQDHIKYKSVEYDLSTEDGRSDFVSALGITGDRADAATKLLKDVGNKGRDEMAQLMIVFDQAERGDRFIERIVFSGHSVGSSVWGDDNGTLSWTNVGKLALIFPKGAGQVQDVLIAACYSGGQSTMDKYRTIFPNVKTIWAYDGSAPGAWSGAVPHIKRWERGTRGPAVDRLDRDVAEHTRKGEYVAVWSAADGYDNGEEPNALSADRAAYDSSADVVLDYLSGDSVVDNPQTGPLRTHYNRIQRLLGRNDLGAEERTQLEGERDQVIRTLYWKNVRSFFNTVHHDAINTGFSELGLEVPDFSKMSRKDAMAKVAAYNTALDSAESPSSTAVNLGDLLNKGLKDLSPSFVPEAWI